MEGILTRRFENLLFARINLYGKLVSNFVLSFIFLFMRVDDSTFITSYDLIIAHF